MMIGLLTVALTLDVAVADPVLGCKLDGLELATDAPGVLGGGRFRVLKVESRFWRLHGPGVNDFKPDGYVKVLIEGDGRRYVIVQTYSRYGMPANSGVSADATPERVKQINPKIRSPKGERERVNGVFVVLGGPLGEETALMPVDCKKPYASPGRN
ncbi:hypothetical protein FV226_22700 [Methylobacterium sp. WL12]|nr:hypothetical protein FV226_22700 [Methylobacterium sp. WL12]